MISLDNLNCETVTFLCFMFNPVRFQSDFGQFFSFKVYLLLLSAWSTFSSFYDIFHFLSCVIGRPSRRPSLMELCKLLFGTPFEMSPERPLWVMTQAVAFLFLHIFLDLLREMFPARLWSEVYIKPPWQELTLIYDIVIQMVRGCLFLKLRW